MALQGCATGNENNITGAGGATSESSSSSTGGTGQTGGTGGETAANSSSSAGGAGGTGGGTGGSFTPPMGTADYPSESESNDNATNANVFDSSTKGFTGSVHPIGDIDVYEVMVATLGSDMTVRISDGMGGCPSGLSTAVRVNGSNGLLGAGNGACPLIDPMSVPKMTNLPVGKTYVHVESASFEVEPFYVVEISLKTPVCGDGALRGTEQCDDGNKVSGDGCSATCMSEAPWEAEVNNTSDKATPLWPGTTLFKAAIKPVGDVDYFSFTLAAGQSPVLMTHDIDNPTACNADTEVTLFDSNGLEVISDGDSGPGACSSINSTLYPAVGMLSAGTYYVRVHDNMNDSVITGYQLDVTVQ
ncbi:MAG TPA: pre-peptidase C-terminal domain-containing protein [Polyangium sp.]|nr:pre-peptidase C-terminal domain-containing protein [Polyangium sp.]